MDPTWGDSSYLQGDADVYSEQSFPSVNYDYLCVTADQLTLTHSLMEEIPLPECDAVKYNYYRKEDLYLKSYDETEIAEIFERADSLSWESVTFQCADENVYDELYRMLIEEQKVFEYLKQDEGTVAYSDSRLMKTFSFWLK